MILPEHFSSARPISVHRNSGEAAMNFLQLIVASLLLSALLFSAPAQAADKSEDELLRNAQNLSLTVPTMGNATLGSQESMSQMLDWLNATSRVLITFFNDTMDLLGLSNTSYVKDMNKAFAPVLENPPAIRK
jgi:hypothetical protein